MDESSAAAIERKFQDTLDEVFALKHILQDFLSSPERSNPTHRSQEASNGHADRPINTTNATELGPHEVKASRRSERLLRRSIHFEPNFQDRIRTYMAKSQRKKEQLLDEIKMKAEVELKMAPTINQRSRRLHRSVHHLQAWHDEKQHKLAILREGEREREVEEVRGVPRTSARSEKMFVNRNDDIAHCKVEDRLHLLGLIYEYQKEERQLVATKERTGSFRPCLAPHSSKLARTRTVSVHDRLYGLAGKVKSSECCNNSSRRSLSIKSNETLDAVVERLTAMGTAYRVKREEMVAQRGHQLKTAEGAPRLSKKSQLFAKKSRSRNPKTDTRCRGCSCCSCDESSARMEDRRIDSKEAAKINERQVRWKSDKQCRNEDEKIRRELAEEDTLTFRNPRYNDAWNTVDPVVEDRNPRCAFFEKSIRWAKEREEQLSRMRQELSARQQSACTFRPSIHPAPIEVKPYTKTPRRILKDLELPVGRGFFSRQHDSSPVLSPDKSEDPTDDVSACVDKYNSLGTHRPSIDLGTCSRVSY